MNRMFFYACMLLIIDMYGMELSKKELSPFKKSFNNVPFEKEEKESFDDFKTNYNSFNIKLSGQDFYYTNSDQGNSIVFFGWILNEYIKKNRLNNPNHAITMNASNGYFYFANNKIIKSFFADNGISVIVMQPDLIFKGLLVTYNTPHNNASDLAILTKAKQILDHKQFEKNIVELEKSNIKIISCAQSVYKIHLMPNDDTVLLTMYRLFELFNTNPVINNQGTRFNDCISNVKIKIPPLSKKNFPDQAKYKSMPVIVLYVANFFLPKSADVVDQVLNSLDKDTFFKKFEEYIDYAKSKQRTEDLLVYLVYFFDKHQECKGSGIVPRFNAKVTDMIFVAQGNGDDKEEFSEFFEQNKIYFKSDHNKNFKIDMQKIFNNAKKFESSADGNKTKNVGSFFSKLRSTNQSSIEQALSSTREPSLGIFAQISNWFKSWFYTLFQMLNLGSM